MSSPGSKPAPVWTRDFLLMIGGTFFQGAAFYFLLPVLPLFVVGPLGGDEGQVGLAVGAFSITSVLFRPLSGYLLDRYGRRALQLIGSLIFCASSFAYAFASIFWVLILLRLVHGLSWGLCGVASTTVVADMVPEQRRGEGMGAYGLSMPLALASGPMIGAWLLAGFDFVGLFIGGGILAAIGLFGFWLVRTPMVADPAARLSWSRIVEPRVLRLFTFWLFPCLGYGALVAFSPLYAIEAGFDSAGPLFSLYAVGALMTRPLAGRAYDRLGPAPVMLAGFSVLLGGWCLLGLAPGIVGVVAGALCLGMGIGASLPAFQTMALDLVEPARRGAATATILSAYDIGIALGAFGSGLLVPHIGLSALFLVAAALTGLGMILFLTWVYPHFARCRLPRAAG